MMRNQMRRDQMSAYEIDYRVKRLLATVLCVGAIIYLPFVFGRNEQETKQPVEPQSQMERISEIFDIHGGGLRGYSPREK